MGRQRWREWGFQSFKDFKDWQNKETTMHTTSFGVSERLEAAGYNKETMFVWIHRINPIKNK